MVTSKRKEHKVNDENGHWAHMDRFWLFSQLKSSRVSSAEIVKAIAQASNARLSTNNNNKSTSNNKNLLFHLDRKFLESFLGQIAIGDNWSDATVIVVDVIDDAIANCISS